MLDFNIGFDSGWTRVVSGLAGMPLRLRTAQRRALMEQAKRFQTAVRVGIEQQAPGGKPFAPLSPFTLAVRQFLNMPSTKALLVRGRLSRGVKVKKITEDDIFVGVLNDGTEGSRGLPLIKVALTEEYGSEFVIQITPKMHAFFMAVLRTQDLPIGPPGSGRSSGQLYIRIPPRPFLQPVMDEFAKTFEAEFTRSLGRQFFGELVG